MAIEVRTRQKWNKMNLSICNPAEKLQFQYPVLKNEKFLDILLLGSPQSVESVLIFLMVSFM